MAIKKLVLAIAFCSVVATQAHAEQTKLAQPSRFATVRNRLAKTIATIRPTMDVVLGVGLTALTAPAYLHLNEMRGLSTLLSGHIALFSLTAHGAKNLREQAKGINLQEYKRQLREFILKYLDDEKAA